MRIKEGFFLKRIDDDVYLLPYGNRIASFSHGVQLVGCGEQIATWLLEGKDVSREELLSMLIQEYGADVAAEELEADLDTFVLSLQQQGLLEDAIGTTVGQSHSPQQCFQIAGIRMALFAPETLVHSLLQPFAADDGDSDIKVFLRSYERSAYPCGQMLLRSKDVVVYEVEDAYGILYPENTYVREVTMTKDGSVATLYLKSMEDGAAEEIFLAMRTPFLLFAQQKQRFALHSVSVEAEEGVVLFSGVSGSGKSTHSRLWETQFGSKVLNGDLNLIGMSDGKVMAYGMPWCGTSEISVPYEKVLHGVFFLQQAEDNRCEELEGTKRTLALSNRIISPTWTKACYEANLDFAHAVQEKLLLSQLYCTMEPQAAMVARERLLTYLKKDNNDSK